MAEEKESRPAPSEQSSPKEPQQEAVTGSGYSGGKLFPEVIEKKGGYGGSAPKVVPSRPVGPAASVNPAPTPISSAPQASAERPSGEGDSGAGESGSDGGDGK